jgi:hypothetical protein
MRLPVELSTGLHYWKYNFTFCFTGYVFCSLFYDALSTYTTQRRMAGWLMNRIGFGRKRFWPNRGTIPKFAPTEETHEKSLSG